MRNFCPQLCTSCPVRRSSPLAPRSLGAIPTHFLCMACSDTDTPAMMPRPFSLEALQCLLISEQLEFPDLLNIRAACKEFNTELAGLPASLKFSAGEDSQSGTSEIQEEQAAEQVQTLVRIAGPRVLKLQLSLLPRLVELHILYEAPEWVQSPQTPSWTELDISPLSALPLEALYLGTDGWQEYNFLPILFTGCSALTGLQRLQVVNGLAVDLPNSVTEFKIRLDLKYGKREPMKPYFAGQRARFKAWFSTFQGRLSKVALDLQLFDNDPAALQHPIKGVPCLRDVADLQLACGNTAFTPAAQVGPLPRSIQWCSGFFRRLQTLHLQFNEVSAPFCPVWDLSTCTELSRLAVSIDCRHPKRLCLAHVTGVTADVFDLHFMSSRRDVWPGFDFTSWTLSRVSIRCNWRPCSFGDDSFKGMPVCVLACLGALQCSLPLPAITVNGLAPAAAVAGFAMDPPQLWDASDSDTENSAAE